MLSLINVREDAGLHTIFATAQHEQHNKNVMHTVQIASVLNIAFLTHLKTCSHRSEALGAFSLWTLPAYAIFLRCFLGVDVTIKSQLSLTLTASEKFHVAKVDFLIYFNINTCTTTHSTQCIGTLSTYIRFWDLLSRRINYASPRFCSFLRLTMLYVYFKLQ